MRYRFGSFELDVERYELTRSGEKLEVQPKVFDVLRYLLERCGRVITKQELLDALWGGQRLNESAVPWSISQARRAIGQRSGDRTPIETVHGRGYRWHGPVQTAADAASEEDPAQPALPFVGRVSLITTLGERLRAVKAGRGGLCLLIGDAGIGKTRCIDELAKAARALGFAVWAGRAAQDTLAPVYFPWIHALRSASSELQRQHGVPALLERLCAHGASATRVDDRDAVLGRLSLFEAVSHVLTECGQRTPLLLVLDDLHWADAGTLELLDFVAAELRYARVLLLAAAREPLGSGRPAATAEAMRHAERFDLQPLSVDEVAEYLRAAAAGATPGYAMCEAVHRLSAGYPLFVQETLRGLLAEHGREALATLPPTSVRPSVHARDVLRGRLSVLGADARAALACASVLGDHFELTDLLRLAAEPLDTLQRALDDAVQGGFVLAEGGHGFRFRHALFREVVYEQTPGVERTRYHRAAALMRQAAVDAAQRKSEIAHHHYRSLPFGDHTRVRAAALDAAQAAASARAFADTAQFYSWALEALALDPDAKPREYAELLLLRAQALRHDGNTRESRAVIKQLVKLAGAHGYGDLLVPAARVLRLRHAMGAVPDRLARAALERALELLPAGDGALRVQAMSLLAWLPPDACDMQRAKAASERALTLARRSGDRETLAEALNARLYALSGPDDIDALLAVGDEMLAHDGASGGWISVEAHSARHCALLHRGDLAGADQALTALSQVAQAHGFLELGWHQTRLRAQRRLLAGDLAVAEAEFARLERAAVRLHIQDASAGGDFQRALLAFVRGGPGTFAPGKDPQFFRERLRSRPGLTDYRTTLARVALAFEHTALAREVLDELAATDFAAVPKALDYLHTLCNLSIVAQGVNDHVSAERLYARLAPYERFNTPNNMGYYEGPVAHFLGMLAAFLGHDARAEQHFALAIELNHQLGLRPLLARSYYESARWSLGRGGEKRGLLHRTRAMELCHELGLEWLAQQARALPAA
jgi:DNA-binding winged helix-turn-helix (wHTH) protein